MGFRTSFGFPPFFFENVKNLPKRESLSKDSSKKELQNSFKSSKTRNRGNNFSGESAEES
jgi:hypothetical protein